MSLDRRGLLALLAAPPAWSAVDCADAPGLPYLPPCKPWPKGIEGQRKADLGDGRYLNPVLAGDRPDPSVLKDGDDYYLTHSSFEAVPGLLIWHSRDLVNWRPVANALHDHVGSVWAPDLCKHGGRYYLYLPVKAQPNDILVMWADRIEGPWSKPVALGLHKHIDPTHVAGEDGQRWLYLSGGDRVKLSADGMKLAGPIEHIYDPWRYPEDWDVESFSPEGPKMLRHGGWWHMLLAVGGTAGPPTGHMIIAARSRTLSGPWEQAPHNPLMRTTSSRERWWSRGHGSLVQGPRGDWWMLYHGYENSFHTLGRQMLLAPARFSADGWFHVDADDGQPLPMPAGGKAVQHGLPLSDDFAGTKLKPHWQFLSGGPGQQVRVRVADGKLHLRATGKDPGDSPPLGFIQGDPAFEVEVDVDFDEGVQMGLMMFYSPRLYAGMGANAKGFRLLRYGQDIRAVPKGEGIGRRMQLRMRCARHVLTLFSRADPSLPWAKFPVQMDVSGYHHNTAGGFASLRPAIYAAGQGEARFSNLRYRAVD
ncbi:MULTISPECIES: family 43 glycosylhydrolase [unclassified Roseateles]|uniref:family 43 glycosylhydrolase n=1 Tax=unclassified Roseateles TaxID=2626991 RepID=UPI0006F38BC7|nr:MULTISPECIES: family 43 glycosylhydrolase [unclassified Roseateles]KQW52195.1 xylan 1,4-beta-xylosidase [Pelomonas sp. Root405]KRA78429.1 xylan 1,4-beta-xylosidase [Pelomonas sp. Root662]